MTAFQKNRATLRKIAPELALRLDRVSNKSPNIQLFPSRKGPVTGRARGHDGRWVTLHSTIDPERESALVLKKLEAQGEGVVVLVGIGLGYSLLGLIDRDDSKEWSIVVVERDLSLLKQAMELFDWTSLLEMEDIHLLVGEGADQVLNAITRIRMKRGFQNLIVIPHRPSLQRDPGFYGPLLDQLRLTEASPLRARIGYRRFTGDHVTVLVLDSSYFLIRESVKALKRLGHKVVPIPVSDGRLIETIVNRVAQDRPDFLLSVNHLGFDEDGKLAELLGDLRMPFAVWYVDSPTFILQDFKRNVSPYCVLFIWDRSYLKPMKGYGFQRAHFLPLATDPSIFRPMRQSAVPTDLRGPVSFVGNSMVEAVEDWFRRFPHSQVTQRICQLAVSLQIENRRLSMEQILHTISENHGLRVRFKDPVHRLNFEAALVWKATLEYRKKLVGSLESFGIRIFGDGGWYQLLNGKARIFPPVNYYKKLPLVFNGTEVNFNATSFQMRSTVNQRVFDAAACGAFLVTDNQPDMEEFFDTRREAVCYEEVDQARDQVAYYLRHPEDRRRIAEGARRRVLNEHTYMHRLGTMITALRDEFGSL